MRTKSQIDADIALTEAALRELHAEQRAVGRARNDRIVAAFNAGASIAEISAEFQLGYAVVQGILFRRGKTQRGRAAVAERLAMRDRAGLTGPDPYWHVCPYANCRRCKTERECPAFREERQEISA